MRRRRCILCGHHLTPLRWWQRGLLRPLPIHTGPLVPYCRRWRKARPLTGDRLG